MALASGYVDHRRTSPACSFFSLSAKLGIIIERGRACVNGSGPQKKRRALLSVASLGTVHTVQGREAEAVIFVLGAPAVYQAGARDWAGGRPNLLNVAVTRAKERLYVIGNRSLWREAGRFRELDSRL